jgi:excisionase family DNA binding protein
MQTDTNIETYNTPYLRVSEAADVLGVSPSLLNKWRVQGEGPYYYKFGRNVRYRHSDLHKWGISKLYSSTSEYKA